MNKLSEVLRAGAQFLDDNHGFANDIDTLLGTTSDSFARSVLGYVMGHGAPTARQMAAVETTAAKVRRTQRAAAAEARKTLVHAHGEASLRRESMPTAPTKESVAAKAPWGAAATYTVERGLTRQVPDDLMPGTTELGRISLRMASADCSAAEYAELLPRYLELTDRPRHVVCDNPLPAALEVTEVPSVDTTVRKRDRSDDVADLIKDMGL